MKKDREWYRIVGPSFVIGIVLERGKCVLCAPYVRSQIYMRTKGEIEDWCKKYGYCMENISDMESVEGKD